MDPIWKKSNSQVNSNLAINNFLAGSDVLLDRELFVFDIKATRAHVNGLQRIGILTEEERQDICVALTNLEEEFIQGNFLLDSRFEDGHSAIEYFVTQVVGDSGGKIHTGRSRNDQVSVATRLWLLAQLRQLATTIEAIIGSSLNKAKASEFVPMPGYTHLQRAMPSTVGLWLAGHAEAFLDNLEHLSFTYSCLNKNPLGTASGFGINLPLDREGVAKELGFSHLQINPQNVQNSRGKYELLALNSLSLCTLDLRRLAWDLSIFMSREFSFISLPEEYLTGSSIMPNKKNPDVVELLRAVHPSIEACTVELQGLLALPSGYQRDLQNTKPAVMRAFSQGLQALALVPNLINACSFNADKMHAAIETEMLSTDLVVKASLSGQSFREAYQVAMKNPELGTFSVESSIKERVSLGGTGNLGIEHMQVRFKTLQSENEKLLAPC